jgi:ATP-dependent Clp protease ATP-binding subunit ClpC
MFERFTERARRVPVFAQQEARALGHDSIGTEHVLLGLLRQEEGLAAVVLASLGVTIEAVREQAAQVGKPGGNPSAGGQLPFTPETKKALELSLREALALGHNHIGTEHVLLGLAREEEGAGSRILHGFGIDSDTLRSAVGAMLPGRPRRHGPPPWGGRRRRFRALAWAREEALEEGNYDLARKLLELDVEQREQQAGPDEPAPESAGGAA